MPVWLSCHPEQACKHDYTHRPHHGDQGRTACAPTGERRQKGNLNKSCWLVMKHSQEHSVKVAPEWCWCVYSLKVCFVSFLSFQKGGFCFPSSLAAQNWTDSTTLYSYVLRVELCSIWKTERKLFEFIASIRRNNMTSCPEWHSHHHGNRHVGGARCIFGPVRCQTMTFRSCWSWFLDQVLLQTTFHGKIIPYPVASFRIISMPQEKDWGAQLGVWGAALASRCLRSQPNRASVDS